MEGIRARGPASLGALLADAELDPEAVAAFEGQLAGLPLEAMMRRLAEVCECVTVGYVGCVLVMFVQGWVQCCSCVGYTAGLCLFLRGAFDSNAWPPRFLFFRLNCRCHLLVSVGAAPGVECEHRPRCMCGLQVEGEGSEGKMDGLDLSTHSEGGAEVRST